MPSTEILRKITHLQAKQLHLEDEIHKHGNEIKRLQDLSKSEQSTTFSPTVTSLEHKAQKEVKHTPPPITENTVDDQSSAKELTSQRKQASTKKTKSVPKTKAHASKKKPTPQKSLSIREQDFAKIWFVRLGIISLITGFVFLSNFAYQNHIHTWSAAPRLIGLYLLSAIILGLGNYLEKARPALSNYGKVLSAGGIAILYYSSYAAHHIERLKVIDSSLLGGLLLLTSAGACLAYALWKKSSTTAIFSIVLAFYSTSINPIGSFTLTSNIILTITGLILLERLRKASIGFITMLGCYLSFVYWQFFVHHSADFVHTPWFILCYWVLFTAITLKKKNIELPFFNKDQSLLYATLNNSLFIALTSIDLTTLTYTSHLGTNLACIGACFLAIALYLYTRKYLSEGNSKHASSIAHLYLSKGLALIALALCIELNGTSVAISLTIQAILTIVTGTLFRRQIPLYAGYIALILGFAYYTSYYNELNILSKSILLSLYLAIAFFLHLKEDKKWLKNKLSLGFLPSLMSVITLTSLINSCSQTLYSQIIILLTLFIIIRATKGTPWYRFMPVPFFHFSHLLSIAAFFNMLHLASKSIFAPLTHMSELGFFILLILTIAAASIQVISAIKWSHSDDHYNFTACYNAIATIVLFTYTSSIFNISTTLILFSILPVLYHLLYSKAKLPNIPFIGFLCYIVPWISNYYFYLCRAVPADLSFTLLVCALAPLVHYFLIKHHKLITLNKIYKWPLQSSTSVILIGVCASFLIIWQKTYLPLWQVSVALTAVMFYYLEDNKAHRTQTIAALGAYLLVFYSIIASPQDSFTLRYTIIAIPLIVYLINRYQPERTGAKLINTLIASMFCLSLWYVASIHTAAVFGTSGLSICWALIGLTTLSIGFITKDIAFRSVSFIILATTVIHVYGVDVWKISPLLRIISFITLGLVLLIVGLFYCKKVDAEEKINPDQ